MKGSQKLQRYIDFYVPMVPDRLDEDFPPSRRRARGVLSASSRVALFSAASVAVRDVVSMGGAMTEVSFVLNVLSLAAPRPLKRRERREKFVAEVKGEFHPRWGRWGGSIGVFNIPHGCGCLLIGVGGPPPLHVSAESLLFPSRCFYLGQEPAEVCRSLVFCWANGSAQWPRQRPRDKSPPTPTTVYRPL